MRRHQHQARTPSPSRGGSIIDVENPTEESRPTGAASAAPPPSTHGGPFAPLKWILRGVQSWLSSYETCGESIGYGAFLRDTMCAIVLGLVMGVLILPIWIYLDYRGIVRFQNARIYRDAAYRLATDPKTIAFVEESLDLKFVTQTEYEQKKAELDTLSIQKAEIGEKVREMEEAERTREELAHLPIEYVDLVKDPLLGLDKFCRTCTWEEGSTCEARAGLLAYQSGEKSKIRAMVELMEAAPACKMQ